MEALFQKNILEPGFPFRLFISEKFFSFPHHWHEEIEIIYTINGTSRIGVNSSVYNLQAGDILLISGGDIHYFLPGEAESTLVIIQFELSIFDNFSSSASDKKFIKKLFDHSKKMSNDWGSQVLRDMERQILGIFDEYRNAREGYKLAIKARLYDLVVVLLRQVPIEEYASEEGNKHKDKLKRLEYVFQYVENNFSQSINLEEAASRAGFSIYHFTRFFKENTGITFGQYLNNYRITKSEWRLLSSEDTITDVAYKSGFNSVKTFNRIFKRMKGCSPSEFRKRQRVTNV